MGGQGGCVALPVLWRPGGNTFHFDTPQLTQSPDYLTVWLTGGAERRPVEPVLGSEPVAQFNV